MQSFTTIKGVSERRRLPRLGKIRLGVKALAKNGQTYPAEVDYFVVPPEVSRVYGLKPKALDVMFPIQDRGVIFPQALKWYGSGRGLKCIGDGERAMRLNEQTGAMEPMDCPCPLLEQGQCARRAHLMVILPKINMGGVYQIDMGSYNSIVDLNSGLDYVEALVGRVAMVPLVLTRIPRETFGGGQRRVHYPLMVSLQTNDIQWINRLRTETAVILERQAAFILPAPADENPACDDEGVVVPESELSQPDEAPETREAVPQAVPSLPIAPAATIPMPSREKKPAQTVTPASPKPASPPEKPAPAAGSARSVAQPATDKQVALIRRLAAERQCLAGYEDRIRSGLSRQTASKMIEELLLSPPGPEEPQESYI